MAANIPPPAVMKLSGDWSTNWDTFRGEWEDYALATGLQEKDDEVVAATLRTIMGTECRHVYKHNLNLTAAQQGNATAILEHYFKPAKNVIYERYVFGCCKQEDGESIDSFVTRLREKAATCDYGALRDELIRDKLVLGITDEGTRRRLLRERDLTLVLAVETCHAAELTDIRIRSMELERQHMDNVNATFRQPVKKFPFATANANTTANSAADNPNTCRYCGISHGRGKEYCPAYGKICKSCGTANHFARVCMKSKRKEGKVHSIETKTDEGNNSTEDVYASECIGAVRAKGQKWFVTLLLNNKPQKCQLDSGATCNVMSLKDKRRLAPRDKLTQSSTKLKLYSEQFMTSLGLFVTVCFTWPETHP